MNTILYADDTNLLSYGKNPEQFLDEMVWFKQTNAESKQN